MEVRPKKKQTHDVTPIEFRELFGCIKFCSAARMAYLNLLFQCLHRSQVILRNDQVETTGFVRKSHPTHASLHEYLDGFLA